MTRWMGRSCSLLTKTVTKVGVTRSYIGISVLPRGTYSINGSMVEIDSAAYLTANTGANGQIGTLAQLNAVWPANNVNVVLAAGGVPDFDPATQTWSYNDLTDQLQWLNGTDEVAVNQEVLYILGETLHVLQRAGAAYSGNATPDLAATAQNPDADGGFWVGLATFAGGAAVRFLELESNVPVTDVNNGDLWYNRTDSNLYVSRNGFWLDTAGTTQVSSTANAEPQTGSQGQGRLQIKSFQQSTGNQVVNTVDAPLGAFFINTADSMTWQWDGSNWNVVGGTTINSINDIADVTITNPQNEQVLTFNGTEWVNADATGGGNVSTYAPETDLPRRVDAALSQIPDETWEIDLNRFTTGTVNAITRVQMFIALDDADQVSLFDTTTINADNEYNFSISAQNLTNALQNLSGSIAAGQRLHYRIRIQEGTAAVVNYDILWTLLRMIL